MRMSEKNVETVRRVYEGVNARLEVPRELFDPDYRFDNTELWPDIWPMALFMVVLMSVALLFYRRTLD